MVRAADSTRSSSCSSKVSTAARVALWIGSATIPSAERPTPDAAGGRGTTIS